MAELPFDEEAYRAASRRPGARRRGRLLDPRAQAPPAPPSTSTASGAASRARARRRSSRRTAHAKVSCRLVARQDPHDIFEKFRDFVLEIAPPGVDVTSRTSVGTGRPSRDADRPSRSRRPPPVALEAAFGRAPVYTPRRRLDPGRGHASSRSSGCRSCSSASPSPTSSPRAERVDRPRQLREARSGPSSRTFDEIAALERTGAGLAQYGWVIR